MSEEDRLRAQLRAGHAAARAETQRRRYSLHELVAAIRPENCHDEIDVGPPVGREFGADVRSHL